MKIDERITKWSENVLKNSVGIKKGDRIYIEGIGTSSREFVMECVRLATKMGAVVFYHYHDDNILKQLINGANEEQMSEFGSMHAGIMQDMDVYLGLRAFDDVYALSDVPAKQMKLYNEYYVVPVHKNIRVPKTRWCVTRIPTNSLAAIAKMSLHDFEDFYYNACNMDYKKMDKASGGLYKLMSNTDKVRIKAPGTELEFSIKGIPVKRSFGHFNLPDGEMYMGPVKDSINGYIQFNTPSTYDGVYYLNVRLEFENGRIVKATSEVNNKKLQEVLATDEGARYMGEFAIAYNPYIERPIGEIAFDEKIKGSIHMAIGSSYEDSFNGNRSAVHWDLVQIHRPEYGGGEIWFDDVLIRKNGVFVLKELKPLNPENLK